GSLVLTLTIIPVLSTYFFRRPPSERESPLLRWLRAAYRPALRWCLRRPLVPIASAAAALALALFGVTILRKEFLPDLGQADICLRVKFTVGISLEGARPYVQKIRDRMLAVPEVRVVVSQLGSPDDGTDPNGPDNCEFFIGLKPRQTWRFREKDQLIDAMAKRPGEICGSTQDF